jgi:hypothetical protein
VGCDRDPLNRQSVSGTVNVNGQPVPKGSILFKPVKDGGTVSGAVIENGQYTIPASKGLSPGDYAVSISAPDTNAPVPQGYDKGHEPAPPELIPPEYGSNTTQKVTVTDGGSNVFDYDIKIQQ